MTHDPASAGGDSSAALAAFEQGAAPVLACEGADLRVRAANAAARRLWGGEAPAGRPLPDLLRGRGLPGLLDGCGMVLRTGTPHTAAEQRVRDHGDARGRDAYFDFLVTPWAGAGGTQRGVVVQGFDVTVTMQHRLTYEFEAAHAAAPPESGRQAVVAVHEASLPRAVPVLPGVDVAARYLLSGDEQRVGGDWFDAVPVPGGKVALVVGDAAGSGLDAGVVMAQLRAVLVGGLASGARIEEALQTLDAFAEVVPDGRTATACVVVLDPRTGQLTYCTSGHPAPLVVPADGPARFLALTGTGPVATGSKPRVGSDVLEPGSLLMLYTNGAIRPPERAATDDASGLARTVASAVAAQGSRPDRESRAERVCNQVLEEVTRTHGHRDDVALLAVLRTEPPEPLELELPTEPASVRAVRGALGTWFTRMQPGRTDELAIQHAVGELVANAIEHAHTGSRPEDDSRVRLSASLEASGRVLIEVRDTGRWRTSDPATMTFGPHGERGRGLATARGLVDEIAIERRETGTTVRLSHRLTRPAQLYEGREAPAFAAGEPDDGFSLRLDRASGSLVVRGALDPSTAEDLRSAMLQFTRGGSADLTVDLSEVSHVSSASVQVLFDAVAWQGRAGQRFDLLAAPGTAAQHILDTVGLPYRWAPPVQRT